MNTPIHVLIAVLDSLWEAALLAVLVWVVLKWAGRVNAATKFAVWWAVLAVVIILPGVPYMIGAAQEWLQPATMQAARPLYTRTPLPTPVVEFSPLLTVDARAARWPMYGAAVWGLILLYHFAQLVRSYRRVRGIKLRASVWNRPLPLIRRQVALLLSGEIESPIAVGFMRPAVILPDSLPGQLSQEELDHVLLHETAHLARWDDWTTLLVRLLDATFALHPIATWILRRIEVEREHACDEWVVTRTHSARPYVRSLAKLYELRFAAQGDLLASGIFSSGSNFAERIEALLSRGRLFSARVSLGRTGASCAALIVLTAGAAFMPHWIAFAQAPRPAFDVASIRRHTAEGGGLTFATSPGGRLVVVNNALSNVINNAYGIAPYQLIGAPEWVNSERYDIQAKGPEKTTQRDIMLMIQTLLADRFAMRSHFETREMPAYILTVAKGGSKLHILNPEDCLPIDTTKPDALAGPNVCGNNLVSRNNVWRMSHNSMPGVTAVLSRSLRGPVIDRTGIKGTFDLTLQWSDDLVGDNPDAPPSLITALRETLGLDLKSGRGPVDVLIIDHIEKPSSN